MSNLVLMLSWPLIAFVRLYRMVISPWLGPACRFEPTCSHYAETAWTEYGPFRGSWLTARRLCKCNPWGASGYDPVPPRMDTKG